MTIASKYSPHELELLRTFIYSYVIGIFKSIKAKDVIHYAEKNLIVDPRPYINSIPHNIKIRAREVLRENPDILDKWIQYDWLFIKLGEVRPDLQIIAQNPIYRGWIEKFMNIIRNALKKI